ncbi:hypothetical protein EUTSA_v10021812mg [Eutrema salsugineum]|uniref:Uncharacterized protein n=1 Tax=Eutrema salsugineum TaxID=72664 RepID=V4M5Y2_EUTSA|nr:hypothetical protein EUTSA_v10021812mg [Eutrema salsugineum]
MAFRIPPRERRQRQRARRRRINENRRPGVNIVGVDFRWILPGRSPSLDVRDRIERLPSSPNDILCCRFKLIGAESSPMVRSERRSPVKMIPPRVKNCRRRISHPVN